ncbi:hypothetical protein ERJ75_001768300 [Trypanosoma vivax]|uniref:Uncharacterized protein n=1 Tax=Trypanosoma vivax (strain Y486) TaxID=1055687 RepID=G0TRJ6_TRYVY|nr:hypothetical protein TRVL_01957 [Trypanosoma vivax]KAH8603977.1 hypothetical protein ERJ75_001768300 [Trypanosoma vivax]CCC46561.1 conserved hypothetical protein [Trypanosoma vivax Y486]
MNTSGDDQEALNYFDILVNSDPRVAFDALHFGALDFIKEEERRQGRGEGESLQCPFPFFDPAVVTGRGLNAQFVIPKRHEAIEKRHTEQSSGEKMKELFGAQWREASKEVLGDNLLHLVEKLRPKYASYQTKRTREEST